MKTPRELLLNRHAAANRKLDAIRAQVLAAESGDPIGNRQSAIGNFWRSLLWPHPKAWAGLAAVWVVIIGVNLSLREPAPVVAQRTAPPAPQIMAALQEQKRMLAELTDSTPPAEAVPPKDFKPRPRSQARRETMSA
jgi:hypothetical protein